MPGDLSDSTVPRLVEGINLASLPLTPKEGFFITRIDGMTGFGDLCSMTGLTPDSAREVLEKLRRTGAVRWDGAEVGTAPPASTAALDPRALAEAVDLDTEIKALILEKHGIMAGQSHYAALEVERRATTKEIKQAYRRLAAVYHPDRFFRRDIGTYRRRLEEICLRLREAHTALTSDRARRLLYDDKLFVAPRLKKRKTQRSRARRKTKLEAHPVMQKIKKGRDYFDAAVEARRKGDILAADASLKLAIACDSQRQGYKDFATALEVELNREKARAVFERAVVASEMHNASEALVGFRRAMEMNPEEAEYLIHYAVCSVENGGDIDEAISVARRAVFRSGNEPSCRQILAQLLERAGRHEEAFDEYEKLTGDTETAAFAFERLSALGGKVNKKRKKKEKKKSLF